MKERIIICWSGGKDSAMSLFELHRQGEYRVTDLLTTVTGEYDRISMHGVRRDLLHKQSKSLGIPLTEVVISAGASNAEYETQMSEALQRFREEGMRKVAFGDIFLEDLKEYRQRQLAELGMECVFPIWQRETRELVDTFLQLGFRAVTTCVDPKQLGRSFVGRLLDREFIKELPVGVDPCGENGEFHTFVFDGPIFQNEIRLSLGETVLRDSFLFCDLVSEEDLEYADNLS